MGTVEVISKLLDLVVVGTMTYERAMQLKATIDAIKAQGRDPSDAEWLALFDDIKTDSDRLKKAAK